MRPPPPRPPRATSRLILFWASDFRDLAGRTLELMEELLESELPPSQHCYSEALRACAEAGQWNAAAQLHRRLLLDIPGWKKLGQARATPAAPHPPDPPQHPSERP